MHEAKDVIMWIMATKVVNNKMVYKVWLFLFSLFLRTFILFLLFYAKNKTINTL